MTDKTIAKYQYLFESKADEMLKDQDFIDKVAKKVINNSSSRKEIDKEIRNIVAKCMNSLFKSLWMKRDFYENDIKNGF